MSVVVADTPVPRGLHPALLVAEDEETETVEEETRGSPSTGHPRKRDRGTCRPQDPTDVRGGTLVWVNASLGSPTKGRSSTI